jgi:hypothetical protein
MPYLFLHKKKKDINNINLVNLNLTEDFVEELSHQVMQFCDENTIEIKFKNLSLKHDNPIMPIEQLENVDSKRNMEKSGIYLLNFFIKSFANKQI